MTYVITLRYIIYGLLNEFIIPNIQRHEPLLRELSVHCLGLSCLLDQVSKISNKYWR